jgi:hypothetical protein
MKKLFLSIILLTFGVNFILAFSLEENSENDQMISQFERLVAFNEENTKNGNEDLNNYVFIYTPGQEYNPALPPDYEFLFEYPGGTTPDAELINQTLLQYNNNLEDGEFNTEGVLIKDYNYQHYVIVINLTYAVQSKLKNNNSSEIQHPSWYKSFSEDETVRDLEHYKDKKDNLVDHFKTKFSFDVFAPDHEYLISFFTVSHDHSLKSFGTNTTGSQFLTNKKTELTIFGGSNNSTDFRNKWIEFSVSNENWIKRVDPTGGSLSIIKATVSNYIKEFYYENGIDGQPCDILRDQILYSVPRTFFENRCTPEIKNNPNKINALFTASLYLEYLYYQYDVHFNENDNELDYLAIESFVGVVLSGYFDSGSTDDFALYIRFNFSTILPEYNEFVDKSYGLKFSFLNMYYNPDQPTVAELKRQIHASQLTIEHYHSKLNALGGVIPPVELLNGVLDYMYGISDLEFPSFIIEAQWENLSKYFEYAASGAYTDTELVELLNSVKSTAHIEERLLTKWLLGDGGGNFWDFTDQDTGALNLSNFIVRANIANSAVGAYKSWAIPYNYDDNYAIGPSNKVLISNYTPVSSNSSSFFNYNINICEKFGFKDQLVQINPSSEFSDWKTVEIDNCSSYHSTEYNNVNFFDKVDLVTLRNHLCYEDYCYDGSYSENYHTSKPVAGFFLDYTGNREKLEELYDDLIVGAQIVGTLFTFGEFAAASGVMKIAWGLFSLSNVSQFYTINNYQQFEDDLKVWFADEADAVYWAGIIQNINVGLLAAEGVVGVGQMAGLTGTLNPDHYKTAAAFAKAADDASEVVDAAILQKYAILKKHGHSITGIYAARNNGNIDDIIQIYNQKIIGINNTNVLNTAIAGERIRRVVLNARLGGANYQEIHVALNAFDNTPGKLAAFGNALKNDGSLVYFFSTGSKSQINLYLNGWSELFDAGRLNAANSKICIQNYSSLNSIARSKVIQFSDASSNSTIVEFLAGLDIEKISILNKYENISEGIIGHKVGYSAEDYENLAEVINDMEKLTDGSTASIPFFDVWLNRSAELANFIGPARLGNELSDNIITSIKSGVLNQTSHVTTLLETKLSSIYPNINFNGWTVLSEVPFKVPITSSTPGGFMKADFVLYRLNEVTQEIELFIIENKLRSTTKFTPAQRARFTVVKNAQDGSDVEFIAKFEVRDDNGAIIFEADDALDVPKNNVLRISGNGDNVADDLSLDDFQFIGDLDF